MVESPIPLPFTAIILAAGMGTRMKSAMPKVMHPVAGRSMIGHVIHTAKAAGATQLITVIRNGFDDVAEEIHSHDASATIAYQIEKEGTGAAVLSAKDAASNTNQPFLILYGDTPLIQAETLQNMLHKLDESDVSVVVLGMTPEDAGAYGRLITDGGALTQIVEYNDANETERAVTLCNSGVMGVKGERLFELLDSLTNENAKGEYYLTDIVAIANANGELCSYVEGDEAEMLGVNARAELTQAEASMQTRLRDEAMKNGVTLIDPSSVFFSMNTTIGNDTLIEPNVYFSGKVNISSNVHIKANCHIEGADIASGASIGPFARLRPGTQLGENVKIGNFVETKKATLAKGAKVSHLSYIGDATVGAAANIGAGTITCNYDGVNKFQTTIEAGAFIGSNTALVAPVTIGANATIGAGSVITKDVNEKSLALTRSKQLTIANYEVKDTSD